MKNSTEKTNYLAPTLKVVEVKVEKGFADSAGNGRGILSLGHNPSTGRAGGGRFGGGTESYGGGSITAWGGWGNFGGGSGNGGTGTGDEGDDGYF